MFQTPLNPFNWHKSARHVSTPVLGLNVFDDRSNLLAVENLTKPLILVIPRPKGKHSIVQPTHTYTHIRIYGARTDTHARTLTHARHLSINKIKVSSYTA